MNSQGIRRRALSFARLEGELRLSSYSYSAGPASGNTTVNVYYYGNNLLKVSSGLSITTSGVISYASYNKNTGTILIEWEKNNDLDSEKYGSVSVYYMNQEVTFNLDQAANYESSSPYKFTKITLDSYSISQSYFSFNYSDITSYHQEAITITCNFSAIGYQDTKYANGDSNRNTFNKTCSKNHTLYAISKNGNSVEFCLTDASSLYLRAADFGIYGNSYVGSLINQSIRLYFYSYSTVEGSSGHSYPRINIYNGAYRLLNGEDVYACFSFVNGSYTDMIKNKLFSEQVTLDTQTGDFELTLTNLNTEVEYTA